MWKLIETLGGYDFYQHEISRVYNCCKVGETFNQDEVGGYYELAALKKLKNVGG